MGNDQKNKTFFLDLPEISEKEFQEFLEKYNQELQNNNEQEPDPHPDILYREELDYLSATDYPAYYFQ
jgi:uncharacterized protein YeaO (DUF488 family)